MAFVTSLSVLPQRNRTTQLSGSKSTTKPSARPPPRRQATGTRRCHTPTATGAGPPSSAADDETTGVIPSSFEKACEQACNAITASLSAGRRRLFVEVDTTNGDATYTTLKTTLPTVRAVVRIFEDAQAQVVLPDAGAAALARRDWGDSLSEKLQIVGLDEYERKEGDEAVFVVVPRASEVDRLVELVDTAAIDNAAVIVVNPDLVDMGVTGLSLNARQLRTAVIDTFESVYFLRVFEWGVLYRCFPDGWSVWVDDSEEVSGFRCIASLEDKPSTDQLVDLVDAELEQNGSDGGGPDRNPFAKAFSGFRRFLSVYTKG